MTEPNFFTDYQNLITSIDNMTKSKQGYGYRYVELTPLLEEVLPKIHENNFILIQTVLRDEGVFTSETKEPAVYEDKESRKRTVEGEVSKISSTPAYVLHSELIHASEQKIECNMPLYVDSLDPQALGSAETYMRRYSIYALLHIKTEDDDGVQASQRGKKNASKPKSFKDFVLGISKATEVKELGRLWYQWKEAFAPDSEEYKNLNRYSSNRKKLLMGDGIEEKDIYSGCSYIVKEIVEGENVV